MENLNSAYNITFHDITSSSMRLQWLSNGPTDYFLVEWREVDDNNYFQNIETLSGNTLGFAVSNLLPYTDYEFKVTAVDYVTGEAQPVYATQRTDFGIVIPPDDPSNLTATNITNNSLTLNWQDNSNNETSFKIYQESVLIGTVVAGVTTFNVTGLSPGLNYDFKVYSFTTIHSQLGASGTFTTTGIGTIPTAPTNLIPTNIVLFNLNAVRLNWTDNSSNESGFVIERETSPGIFSQIPSSPTNPNVSQLDIFGLPKNTTQRFRIKAFNGVGDSAYTNEASVLTPDTSPYAPTNLTAPIITQSSIKLTWTDASNNETGFIVKQQNSSGVFVTIATLPAGTTEHTINSLSSGTSYTFQVAAYNAVGNSVFQTKTFTTTSAPSGGSGGNPTPTTKATASTDTGLTNGQKGLIALGVAAFIALLAYFFTRKPKMI